MSAVLDTVVAYKFIKILSTPWEKTDAFKLGIIDAKGNILRKRKTLTTGEEKIAYNIFHTLIWNIKKLLDKLPPTRNRLGSFLAALFLLKEECEKQGMKRTYLIDNALMNYMDKKGYDTTFLAESTQKNEDAPVNSTGPGIAMPDGPVLKRKRRKMKRFTISSEEFCNCKRGKPKFERWNKYINMESDIGKQIKAYSLKFPGEGIMVEDETTGETVIIRRRWDDMRLKHNLNLKDITEEVFEEADALIEEINREKL